MMFIPEKIKLLFIEDGSADANATVSYLNVDKHIDFEIVRRVTLKDGLEYLTNYCPSVDSCNIDVILLDLTLPNSEGVSTYQRVRVACDFVPVVIISRHEDIACQCVKLGAQDFLLKPDLNTNVVTRSLKYAIERKKLEDDRMLLQNQFDEVIASSPLGVHMYELKGGHLIFSGYNPGADAILKVNNIQFLHKPIEEAFPTLDPEISKQYLRVIQTGIPWNADIITYEDDQIKGNFRVHAFKTGPKRMATSFEDITIRAKIENELKLSEKKYRDLVEATNAGIYEIDFVNDKFTYVNDVMCKLTGWSREELLNMGPSSMLTKKSIEDWIIRWEALNNGEYIEKTFEYEAKIKDGSTIWTLVTAEYEENEEGAVVGARVVAIDITEAKTIRKEIKQKEESIFNELENKLHEWRDELKESSTLQQNKIRDVSMNIQSITNTVGV